MSKQRKNPIRAADEEDLSLEEEIRTYEQQKERLLKEAEGRYVLIKGSRVLGIYDSQIEAIEAGYDQLGNVAFLARKIVPVQEAFSVSPGLLAF